MISTVKQTVHINTLAINNRFCAKLLASLLAASIGLGVSAAIARAESQQITLSIDGTQVATYSDLIEQAELLAETTISQQFQSNPSLTELRIVILGDRNGQLVSLLASDISRSAWQAHSDMRQWTRYFTTSGALLGYRNSTPLSTRVVASNPISSSLSRRQFVEQSPSQTLEQARLAGRISEDEYWQLVDAMD